MFTILNTATFSVHVFYTLLQPNHLSFFLFLALWSIASQQREAVLHIQQQMKVRLPMCSSFTPVDRACSTHKAPICITGTLTVMKSIIFLYCHSSDDLDCQCRNCYLSAVTNIWPAVDRHVTVTIANGARDRRGVSLGGQMAAVTNVTCCSFQKCN